MRRPIQMQPLGNMHNVVRPQRVSSSTCKRPQLSQSGTTGGYVDEYAVQSDAPVSGIERHVSELMLSGDVWGGSATHWNQR
jgi:hypothetical protein